MKKLKTKQENPEQNKSSTSIPQRCKIVRIFSLLTSFALLFALLAACGNGGENGEEDPSDIFGETWRGDGAYEEEPENGADEPQNVITGSDPNLEAAMTTFNRNDVMISAGDQYITWAELYVFIFGTVANLTGSFEIPVDWLETPGGEMTLAEMVLEQATDNAIAFLTYRYGAAGLGVSLSPEEIDEINIDLQGFIDSYGGHEDFARALREDYGFYDYDVFEDMIMTESLIGAMMRELYGEQGVQLADSVAADFAERNGYMMAKHILVLSAENDLAREEIEEIYEQLRPRADDADFEEFFSALMLEYSEDPGSFTNPDGYLFQHWDMVEPFSNAAMELLPGEMSAVVETSFGYHIILRVPMNYDGVPISVANAGMTHTIRQMAASEDFESRLSQWHEEMNISFSELHSSIDLARIFSWLAA